MSKFNKHPGIKFVKYSSASLFLTAWNAYLRTKGMDGKDGKCAYDIYITIFFSQAYIEGFLNEIINMTEFHRESKDIPHDLKFLRKIWDDFWPFEKKIQTIHLAITGNPYDVSNPIVMDVLALCKIRNKIIHLKPIKSEDDEPYFITYLERRSLLATIEELRPKGTRFQNLNLNWNDRIIFSPKIARWACETGLNLYEDLINKLPKDCPMRSMNTVDILRELIKKDDEKK